jgi:hypothetical protein
MRVVLRRIVVGCVLVVAVGVLPLPAMAAPECVRTPLGIECAASGSTGTTQTTSRPGSELPPLRYLVTAVDASVGPCWYWSRYGPGYDSWDAANDQIIILTRTFTPECPSSRPTPPASASTTTTLAWNVFRSFPLPPPNASLSPWPSGFTGIPTRLTVRPGPSFHHDETLPDGTPLRVRAAVVAVSIRWGDGSPVLRYPVEGPKEHTFARKTCSSAYREQHPSGRLCHPVLEAYPIEIAFVWLGEYVRDDEWVGLGEIERPTSIAYDVDEIVGVPER